MKINIWSASRLTAARLMQLLRGRISARISRRFSRGCSDEAAYALLHEYIEGVISDPGLRGLEVLRQIEVRAPLVVDGDHLAIEHGLVGRSESAAAMLPNWRS